MTPPIYLPLFVTIFLTFILYAYDISKNEESLNLAFADKFKENQSEQRHTSTREQRITTLLPMFGSTQPKKVIKLDANEMCEMRLRLKKYNQQLNRSLNTLIYITKMEAGSAHNLDQLKDLLNLKQNVQYEVIRITRQINNCKAVIEDKIPA